MIVKGYNLIKPALYVSLNGIEVTNAVSEVSVTLNGHQEPNNCEIKIDNNDGQNNNVLNYGKDEVFIQMGYYADTPDMLGQDISYIGERYKKLEPLFRGWVDTKTLNISKDSGNTITLTARDATQFLIDSKLTARFGDNSSGAGMTIENIIRKLAELSHMPLRLNLPEAYKFEAYPAFEVDEKSYWDIALDIASIAGLDTYVDIDGTWYFGVYEDYDIYLFEFELGKNISNLEGELNMPNSVVGEVIVSAYDEDKQKQNAGIASYDYLIPETEIGVFQKRKLLVVNDYAVKPGLAKFLAQQRLNEEQRKLKTVTLNSQFGIPFIKESVCILLKGCGIFDQYYWIRETTHTQSKDGGYVMTLNADRVMEGETIEVSE